MPVPPPTAGYQYQPQPQAPPPVGYAAAPPQAYAYPPQAYAYSPVPYVPRVQSHLRTLGILWCVYGGYRIFAGIAASVFLFGMSHSGFFDRFDPAHSFPFAQFAPIMGGIAAVVLIMTVAGAALAFLTGFALLNRKSWGRTLAIVAAVLSLIKIPVGTAIGIYTLWVLAPGQSGVEYDAMADHR
jgi:apolipoprotein N-acyltransferase